VRQEVEIDNFQDQEVERKRKQIYIEPQMDFSIEQKMLALDYVNIDQVKVSYYIIDLETLFSKSPFLSQGT